MFSLKNTHPVSYLTRLSLLSSPLPPKRLNWLFFFDASGEKYDTRLFVISLSTGNSCTCRHTLDYRQKEFEKRLYGL